MINISMLLDGNTDEYGYKFIVKRDCCAWCAFKTANGFTRFLRSFGLKINPKFTQLHDMREAGRGRVITAMCHEKAVIDKYFWSLDEVPRDAVQYIDLCNGRYVNCYLLDSGDSVTEYRPNPNAKNVYIPYDYFLVSKMYG